ncbi:MAG: cytidylate kinase [Bacteroidetes bacterium HGW-Bacteroidetes-2]|jgi:cytidylate kinase|nr:MAG: cytidylate kinase [Bacteroidetes bacterium HGW-Bacteroidetes-2]
MKKITIAIDGYSSTGKSTVAKRLAAHLGYLYVDTGAMYRAIALFALENGLISKTHCNQEKLIEKLPNVTLYFELNPATGIADMYLNGKNVEERIRSLEVSQYVSRIAEISEVRKKLVEQQHKIGKQKGVVMDGRDIGTVVFPQAELKIFLNAAPQERARRRYKEYIDNGAKVTFEEILKNVMERDRIDTTRKDSPLVKAQDAIELDNTFTNKEDFFQTALQLAKDRIAGRNL